MEFSKFVAEPPSDANAIALFSGRWVVEPTGPDVAASLRSRSESDLRVPAACQAFGSNGRLDGMQVLELGPLEGGHTYMLERAGATVTAIEGNAEAYMKCLIVKEALQMKSRFLLGNFVQWLEEGRRYDLIFASGVLYHMPDPAGLIRLVAQSTDRALFWTHYYEPNGNNGRRLSEPVNADGLDITYHRLENLGGVENPRWWGGIYDSACWLDRPDLISTMKHYGFANVEVLSEQPEIDSVPAHLTLACSK